MEAVPSGISIRRGCELLGLNRSTLYYEEKPVDIDDIDLLNTIRDIWERRPFFGYRKITKELRENYRLKVNRKRVQRLMALGGIKAIHPGPNTSKRNKQHAIHPYLLKDTPITRPNQAWMVDITYLRMPSGFMYLVAIIDVYSRYIVGWSLSNTLDTEFCLEALKSALRFETPEIINSDQGCQFTSEDWIEFLREWGIRISMTGKGRCADNIFIERFWRSLKGEEVYLNEYGSVKELKEAIDAYIEFYNEERWHQALGYKRPAEVYFAEERKACGYVDESEGRANALRDVGTN
jgi:putative transposase